MVDTRTETLESETWPLLPTVGYPSRWRWLQDTATQRALEAEYPDAAVTSSLAGHLTVRLPAPQIPRWEPDTEILTEGDMSLIDDLIEISQGSDTFALLAEKTSEVDAGRPNQRRPARYYPLNKSPPPRKRAHHCSPWNLWAWPCRMRWARTPQSTFRSRPK